MKKLQSTLNLGGGGLALGYYRVWGSSSTRVGYCRSGMAGLVSGGSGTGTVAPRVAATSGCLHSRFGSLMVAWTVLDVPVRTGKNVSRRCFHSSILE